MARPVTTQEGAERFAVLGDPNRLRLLLLIHREGPFAVGDLATATGLRPTTVSHALRLLRFAGLVGTAREGKQKLYWLTDEDTSTLLADIDARDTLADLDAAPDPVVNRRSAAE